MTGARSLRRAIASGQSPTFWIASGLIFSANALFSVIHGYWLLGVLQLVTAGMAALAAAERLDARHAGGEHVVIRSERQTEWPGDELHAGVPDHGQDVT